MPDASTYLVAALAAVESIRPDAGAPDVGLTVNLHARDRADCDQMVAVVRQLTGVEGRYVDRGPEAGWTTFEDEANTDVTVFEPHRSSAAADAEAEAERMLEPEADQGTTMEPDWCPGSDEWATTGLGNPQPCPVCDQPTAVRPGGRLRHHLVPQPPVEVES